METQYVHVLQPGSRLKERYVIQGVLGEGGFGITYLGYDELLAMPVAVKEYYPQNFVARNTAYNATLTVLHTKYTDFFRRGKSDFLNEARMLAKFQDEDGIVRVMDFFEMNNTAYIVMEYLDGITLKDYLKQNGSFGTEDILELLYPVMDALAAIHASGLIHRDISPDNIMLLQNNRVKLMDFGAARDYTAFGEKSLSILLKYGYAPEEQYRSHGMQGPWTDIYALCATIYKCITGVTPVEAIQRLVGDTLKKPSELGVSINPQTEYALMKGLSVFQKDRYQDVRELQQDLYGNGGSFGIRGGSGSSRGFETSGGNGESGMKGGYGNGADGDNTIPLPDDPKTGKAALAKEQKNTGVIAILVASGCLLVAAMLVLVVVLVSNKNTTADNGLHTLGGGAYTDMDEERNISEDRDSPSDDTEPENPPTTTEEIPPTTASTTEAEAATEPAEEPVWDESQGVYDSMPYLDNAQMDITACLNTSAYAEAVSGDGSFTFRYPKYTFNTSYANDVYNEYSFAFVDSSGNTQMELKFYKDGYLEYTDPIRNAELDYETYSARMDEVNYNLISDEPDKNGFARSIIAGSRSDIAPMNAEYILVANNGVQEYIMEFRFYDPDIQNDYDDINYLMDCIYRYCSFSGSTYKPRGYKKFLKDDMGQKKASASGSLYTDAGTALNSTGSAGAMRKKEERYDSLSEAALQE